MIILNHYNLINIIFYASSFFLFIKEFTKILRNKAYNEGVSFHKNNKTLSSLNKNNDDDNIIDKNNKNFGFVSESPGYGYRGFHQLMVHLPIFILHLLIFLVIHLPKFIFYLLKYNILSFIYYINLFENQIKNYISKFLLLSIRTFICLIYNINDEEDLKHKLNIINMFIFNLNSFIYDIDNDENIEYYKNSSYFSKNKDFKFFEENKYNDKIISLRFQNEPKDEDIYNYCVETSLFLLAKIEEYKNLKTNEYNNVIVIKIPKYNGIEKQCYSSVASIIAGIGSIEIILNPLNKSIIDVTVLDNVLDYFNNNNNINTKRLSLDKLLILLKLNNNNCYNFSISNNTTRNDLLMSIVHLLVTTWIHPSSHRQCEINAIEIYEKNVKILEPSSRFVESLHEGLLEGMLSPAYDYGTYNLFYTGLQSTALRYCINKRPIPPHVISQKPMLSDSKLLYSKSYLFFIMMRQILFELVYEFDIKIDNKEALFHNLIVHSIDHYSVEKKLKEMNIEISMDGSCSLLSYWRFFVYKYFWLTPKTFSFLENEKLSNFDKIPGSEFKFYKKIYRKALKIDSELADELLTSCSF